MIKMWDIFALYFSEQQGVITESPPTFDVTAAFNDVMIGGAWKPKECVARHRVAIVIPYRDRQYHLKSLLKTLVPVLKSQNVHFQIFVSEQVGIMPDRRQSKTLMHRSKTPMHLSKTLHTSVKTLMMH